MSTVHGVQYTAVICSVFSEYFDILLFHLFLCSDTPAPPTFDGSEIKQSSDDELTDIFGMLSFVLLFQSIVMWESICFVHLLYLLCM